MRLETQKKRKMEKLHIKKNWTKQSENLTSWKTKQKKVEKSWDLTNWMKWKTIVSNKNLREKLRFKVVCLDIPITFKPTKKT